MTREENQLLTETGPGTPCGALLRRYWQPAALSEEMPPGGAPVPIRLLGEDLVLFRDDRGRPGLLGLHCSHRGADLSYGRVEDGGLRCIYHGWLYDIHGHCLDQPGEPGVGEHRGSIRHPAYPCHEQAGVIFAYLGTGEVPLFPNYEFLNARKECSFVTKIFQDCNFLQGHEGNLDPGHTSFLHGTLQDLKEDGDKTIRGSNSSYAMLQRMGRQPAIELELTDFGMRICTIRNMDECKSYVKVTNFIYPNLVAVNADIGRKGGGYLVNWHVPTDDTHHCKYVFVFSREAPLPSERNKVLKGLSEITSDYRLVRNKANRYMQDRDSMKTESFSGLGSNFQAHDSWATVGAGSIQDRLKEHLVSSDKAIVAGRKLLLKAIRDVQEGLEAPHVIREPKLNRFPHLVVMSEVVPTSVDWKDYIKKVEAKERV